VYQLAQVNVGRMLAPIDSSTMRSFVALLDEINALAERSPGFVWRLKGEGNDATSLRPFDDDMIIVNMSVWEGIDALRSYVYGGAHAAVMRRRRSWFSAFGAAYMALWWVPAGHLPDTAEARERLLRLQERGETPEAFSFKRPFPPPVPNAASG
jgi:hypothetical protein